MIFNLVIHPTLLVQKLRIGRDATSWKIQGELRRFGKLVANEGPSLETSKFSLNFSGSCIPGRHEALGRCSVIG
jgi:hypothetical protein